MNGTTVEPPEWSAGKRGLYIAIAVATQMFLIWWFSDRSPSHPRKADSRPAVQLAAVARNEILPLTDPSLFPLAHPDGFSGHAWLTVAPHDYQPEGTATAPQWLAMVLEDLSESFHRFVQTNQSITWASTDWIQPAPAPGNGATMSPAHTNSTVVLEGAIATRGLVQLSPLQSWPSADILAPSVVQVLIDELGNPISATLLETSGLKAADRRAIDIARAAQFRPASGLSSGRLIFQWHSLPTPPNDAGTATPH